MYSKITASSLWSLTMPRFIDRTDQRFGKLTVIQRNGTDRLRKVLWRCRCDCGAELDVVAGSLVTGNTTSCGCYLKERITKHGGWKKASYNTWRAMMRRCYNPKDKDFKRYGALGVTVCSDWHTYTKFAEDVGEPEGTQTLDRIDPYGGYSRINCRWASITQQNRNLRVRPASKSGYIGVHQRGGKWYGEITVRKKKYYSKACGTVEEAAAARKELECIHWGNT